MANAAEDGQAVTATATDPGGNTSEFSACVTATAETVVEVPDSYDWRYTYDALGRLSTACSQWDAVTETCEGDSFSYSYDGAGNLTALSRWDEDAGQVETVGYLYNGANQIRCVDADLSGDCDGSEIVWQYDATGNLLDDGTQAYTYDAALRLASVSDGTSTTTYSYNGDGDRVGQTVDGVATSYVLDIATPLTMVLAETTGTETIATLHGLDLVAQSDGTTTEYFAYDGLGSVRQVANASGDALLSQTYDPYGSLYARAGADVTSYGFTGEQADSSGLLYLRARYYAPGMGRFLNMDPSRQEMNPYQYGASNPILYTDPSGEIVAFIVGGLIIGAVTAAAWDVFVVQGKGGIDNLPNAFKPSHYCDVDWRRTALYAGTGGIIGLTVGGVYAGGAALVSNITLPSLGEMLGQAAAWEVGAKEFAWAATERIMASQGFSIATRAVGTYAAVDNIDDTITYFAALFGNKAAQEQVMIMASGGMYLNPFDGLNSAKALLSGADARLGLALGRRAEQFLEDARFAQKTYGPTFSEDGTFGGSTIDEVAAKLSAGQLTPEDVPIDYIIRDGNVLMLNTRSAHALEQAGIPRSQWYIIDRTGESMYEGFLDDQLTKNKLTSEGFLAPRRTGGPQ